MESIVGVVDNPLGGIIKEEVKKEESLKDNDPRKLYVPKTENELAKEYKKALKKFKNRAKNKRARKSRRLNRK